MSYVDLNVEIDTEDLARELAWGESHESLIDFVLGLDLRVGDSSFTKNLIAELEKSIEDEGV
ncbi:hypothetical protein E1264_03715 [Actinomadura sp. KC216]|uniref:hypothetical protein n=1 Tax=Actinomadura sp. KC216 TaxID=2530370 RepID=UPI0010433DA4|nr:hypothetical protein [Actinomadura sp. KC216]TDB90925.1 hypothetical protein E1264_03715 [Actinomadura sp. KC216]